MRRILISALLSFSLLAGAQKNEIISPRIATLQVTTGDNWLNPPIVNIHDKTPIVISFDDMTHEYHRYAYRIEHREADWRPSEELFQSDYIEGIAEGIAIDDVRESAGTNTLYTHYSFTIPNDNFRIKLSGNYSVTVYDDVSGEDILRACFMVVEPRMGVHLNVSTNTDIDINRAHQQVSLSLSYGGIQVSNPAEQITTVVLQNFRWSDCRFDVKPDYIMGDGLKWNHNRRLIFNAGNEYRKFELTDPDHATMGIERISWDGREYNARLWPAEPRLSYVYDEDANGAFYIRNHSDANNATESEYVNVTFTLKAPLQNGDVYINGMWTGGQLTPQYKMQWDALSQGYCATLPLKLGYYSYEYILRKADGTISPVSTEGNFSPTENRYQALVYYRGNGERTDRLVGYNSVRIK
jgi:hypothetical protein